MNQKDLEAFIESRKFAVIDGATGTNLMRMGLPSDQPPEKWVLENPEAILQLHRAFIEGGADIVLTSTFGASRLRLESAGLAECFEEINRRAVEIARQAAENSQVLVAASIGPLGHMLKPMGTLEVEQAEGEYRAQARVLAESGADLLVIETQFDIQEAAAAVRGALAAGDMAVVCSFSYDRGTRTMMGVRPEDMAAAFNSSGVSALGINCGRSLADNLSALKELQAATPLPIWFKPNAGLPHIGEDGSSVYDIDPDAMAAEVESWIEHGARFVGGCCGTTPEHLAGVARQIYELTG